MKPKEILVFGASGQIGRHLIRKLTKNNYKVVAVTRNIHQKGYILKTQANPGYLEIVELPYFNIEKIKNLLEECSICINLIGILFEKKKNFFKNIHTDFPDLLSKLSAKKNIEKFIHLSSLGVEKSLDSNYAISKYKSELEVWRGIEEGLDAVIVNPSIILGPGKWQKGSSIIFQQVWKGMPFYTTGTNGFVDVRDVTNVMIQLMESKVKSERFILCAESIPFRQTFDYIAEALGKNKANIKVGPFLTTIGWRLAKIISVFTRKTPILTKETALAGNKISIYKNDKIKKKLNFEFKSVEQSCKDFSKLFLNEYTNK